MKLQILVNHYREGPVLLGRLLESIKGQMGINQLEDFEVLICNDGEDNTLDSAFLSEYSFRIQYFIAPHRGVCATRNVLLSKTDADYIMFCDADDCFNRMDGLSMILTAAATHGPDVIISPFLAEIKDKTGYRCIKINDSARWVHGKAFRREYLLENEIRFHNETITTGDMYFLWQAANLTRNIYRIPIAFYTWKWNGASVTRAEPYHKVRTYNQLLLTYSLLTDNLISRKKEDLYNRLIATSISTSYVDSHSVRWNSAPEEYVNRANAAITGYIRQYRRYYDGLTAEYKRKVYDRVLLSNRTYGPKEGLEGLTPWMDEMS